MTQNAFADLNNKVCVITGGCGALGSSFAAMLAANGVKVAVLDRNEEMSLKLAATLKQKYGAPAIGVVADVTDRPSLESAMATIHSELGSINFLINGAGGNHPAATTKAETIPDNPAFDTAQTFFGLSMEGFRSVFDLNFLGTLLPTMVLGQEMAQHKSGVILNISSMNAFRPLTKIPAYSASKAAINNFTQWLAVHFAKVNVRVNAIAPGFFLTEQNRFLLTEAKTGALTARGEQILGHTPQGRFGTPDDLQGAVLYLLSDLSRFVTGVVLPVDGGFSAYSGV